MHIYIANTTKQIHIFSCRLPERQAPYEQPIGIGRQIKFPGNSDGLPDRVMKGIIGHHERYGMVHVSKADSAEGYVGLCWSEKPIEMANVLRLIEHNIAVQEEQGAQAREDAAVATSLNILEKSGIAPHELNLQIDVKEVTGEKGMAGRDANTRIESSLQVTADPKLLQEAENQGRKIVTPRTPRQRRAG